MTLRFTCTTLLVVTLCALCLIAADDTRLQQLKAALKRNNQDAQAWSDLGELYRSTNQPDNAVKCFKKVIELYPDSSLAYAQLGSAFRDLNEPKKAITSYRKALELQPEYPAAMHNLALCYMDLKDHARAEKVFRTAMQQKLQFHQAHYNLASLYKEMGRYDAAVEELEQAIQHDPTQSLYHHVLGMNLHEMKRYPQAIAHFERAVQLSPGTAHYWYNFANCYRDQGSMAKAVEMYKKAIGVQPNADSYNNLGIALHEMGKNSEALNAYKAGLPYCEGVRCSEMYNNIAVVYKDLGRPDDAMQTYAESLRVTPMHSESHINLASMYKDNADYINAISHYKLAFESSQKPEAFFGLVHSRKYVCDWTDWDANLREMVRVIHLQIEMGANPSLQPLHALSFPFPFSFIRTLSDHAAIAVRKQAHALEIPSYSPTAPAVRDGSSSTRLRVGYTSSNFGNHPVSYLMQSVFGMFDRSKVEVFCFALSENDGSSQRRQIEAECEHFVDLTPFPTKRCARMIHEYNLHVLINLNGYTEGGRNEMYVAHLAPVQASLIGFSGTMADADFMPYLMTDKVASPPPATHYHTEHFVYLPNTYFVSDHRQSAANVQTLSDPREGRSSIGLPVDSFIYACFVQLYKINPETWDMWMRILHRVPNSVLWLLRLPPHAEKHLKAEAVKRGIAGNRILFRNLYDKDEHIQIKAHADLLLDPPVYNGHSTATDLLWAGVPMITMPMDNMAARGCASVVHGIGCDETIVYSQRDYEELAVALAHDPARLGQLRRKVSDSRMSAPLYDTALWVLHEQMATALMWEVYAAGLQPQHIVVANKHRSA
eukprot:TRINITY_DN9669_c0_g4_i1.p1 TRINITY_DN9669_c0_g4~~TRINITY_DN9669_c0_g4_i1.p1  ORF type:complete len:848 (-),score=188.41 TRINITY_DN9669_c0_g4_i1:50-2530(-)